MRTRLVHTIVLFLLYLQINYAQKPNSTNTIYDYSLKDLSEINISTGTIKTEEIKYAPSNIIIVTTKMIEERGYQTLVDICQDIPGFDFMMYNDAGGEYPTYNMHRGLGDIGNPEILIMVDGIVQNNISFNWSLLWGYNNALTDVERIEIIQGPGTVMYGAQASSGVIHIITKNKFNGITVKSFLGSNQTWGKDIHFGKALGEYTHVSLSLSKYTSKGDNGVGRYDPGNYFSNNLYPATIVADYDSAGKYIQNYSNPKSGQGIPDGFNTVNNSLSFRTKLVYKNSELGLFVSDAMRGNASAIVPYEYGIANKENTNHYRSYHSYIFNTNILNDKTSLESKIVFRATHILPDGGFRYLYQFPELSKKYAAYAYQAYLEEKILYTYNKNNVFSFGLKGIISQKSERIISLGGHLNSHAATSSSYDIAIRGGGINQPKEYPIFYAQEAAMYGMWDKNWVHKLSSSMGVRYDYSSEYGSILNPRLAVDYNPKDFFGTKLMYGHAFRQPSIFELTSEFRGNPDLQPQKVATTEIELHSIILQSVSIKVNAYYSSVNQYIGKVSDSTMPSGERYKNIETLKIAGLSCYLSTRINKNINLYSNYNLQNGVNNMLFNFFEMERVAKHKINAGFNLKTSNNKLVSDIRINYVGKRKAHSSNTWLHEYQNGYAPAYLKFNGTVSYLFANKLTAQLVVQNIFNTPYYGLGRETGSGFIDDYDYRNNINPSGHIPAYHPQPGRIFLINLIFKLDNNE